MSERNGSMVLEDGKIAIKLQNTEGYAPNEGLPWTIEWSNIRVRTDDQGWKHRLWRITIGDHEFDYRTGTGIGIEKWHTAKTRMGRAITVLDPWGGASRRLSLPEITHALGSLFVDASVVEDRTLDEFAEDMGITRPSEAIRTYQACQEQAVALRRILGADQDKWREALEEEGAL